jgi:hypothetical protein
MGAGRTGAYTSSAYTYRAVHDYDPAGAAGCIPLAVGDVVVVVDDSREDWWRGHVAGAEPPTVGSFPKAFVAPSPVRNLVDIC